MSILYKCDRCGNVFENVSLENSDYILQIKDCEPIDLCDDCINSLKQWLNTKENKMTNGERIRSMTDEELANTLPSGDCFCCPIIPTPTHPAYDSCEECALAWLKSEED